MESWEREDALASARTHPNAYNVNACTYMDIFEIRRNTEVFREGRIGTYLQLYLGFCGRQRRAKMHWRLEGYDKALCRFCTVFEIIDQIARATADARPAHHTKATGSIPASIVPSARKALLPGATSKPSEGRGEEQIVPHTTRCVTREYVCVRRTHSLPEEAAARYVYIYTVLTTFLRRLLLTPAKLMGTPK